MELEKVKEIISKVPDAYLHLKSNKHVYQIHLPHQYELPLTSLQSAYRRWWLTPVKATGTQQNLF